MAVLHRFSGNGKRRRRREPRKKHVWLRRKRGADASRMERSCLMVSVARILCNPHSGVLLARMLRMHTHTEGNIDTGRHR